MGVRRAVMTLWAVLAFGACAQSGQIEAERGVFFPRDESACTDADEDGVYTDCDDPEQLEIDCDDRDGDNWESCATCVDQDGDLFFTGCDAYGDRAQDCDDTDPHQTERCDGCVDQDDDGFFAAGCVGSPDPADCDDADNDNWVSCDTCLDEDGDEGFVGCDQYLTRVGPDCDDENASAQELEDGVCGAGEPDPTPRSAKLRIATFNTLFRGFDKKYPSHTWAQRRGLIKSYISNKQYEIFGFQDVWGNREQYRDVRDALGGSYGLTSNAVDIRRNPIAFLKSRFSLQRQGHFKLPGEASKYATWAKLYDEELKRGFYVFNCHLSAYEAQARTEAAQKVRDKVNDLTGPNALVFLLGDFNSFANGGNSPHGIFKDAGFREVFQMTDDRRNGSNNTRHGFRANPKKEDRRIDRIFVRSGKTDVTANFYRTDTDKPSGKYTSDHFPVMGNLTLE